MITERARFVQEAERAFLPFAELCRRHGISRPTGHKWLERYRAEGLAGLEDRSHRPHSCPHLTPEPVVERILEIRRHRGWGTPKIQRILRDEFAHAPSIDAIHRVFPKQELVVPKKAPEEAHPPGSTAHFHGRSERHLDDRLQGGVSHRRWYALLPPHRAGRSLPIPPRLPRHGAHRDRRDRRRFEHLFREYGLPERIRSDNGIPFSSQALGGLSQLSVWWIKLGITPELIEPGNPQQNGRHERSTAH